MLSRNLFLFCLCLICSIGVCSSNITQERATTCLIKIPNGLLTNCTGERGSYCSFACNKGFQKHVGIRGLYCNGNGKWSVQENILCSFVKETTTEKVPINTASVLCGAAAGFLVICVLYVLLSIIKQKRRKLKKEERSSFSLDQRRTDANSNTYLETVTLVQAAHTTPTVQIDSCQKNLDSPDSCQKNLDSPRKPKRADKEHLYNNVFQKGSRYENV